MYTLITIFYISLAAMALMIMLKRREVETGRVSFLSRIGAGTDHVFQAVFTAVRRGLSYLNRRTFAALAQMVAFHALFWVRRGYVEVKSAALANPHGKRLIDAVRGRGEVTSHGASFYLRRISADHPVK